MNYTFIFIIIALIIAVWYAWRYYNLRRNLNDYIKKLRQNPEGSAVSKELENLSSAVASLVTTFNTQHAAIDDERARLATVLDQMTDGVLIADSQGLIQFANPAAGRLFQTSNLTHRSITEVIRNHQLVEAWRRCQQTGQMQTESVEVPTRHQFLQLVVIPDAHASGSLL
ncbi:MAG: PAS domain-containing protein, partial [Anaerolineae bacterium]|nr:PAS domain-containing protein [Anaerolineae bacterium]